MIIFFASEIFGDMQTAYILFPNFLGTLICIFIVDSKILLMIIEIGRRPLIILGSITLAISLLGCIILSFLNLEENYGYIFYEVLILIYIFSFGLSYGPVWYI